MVSMNNTIINLASRMANRVQLSADGHRAYEAVVAPAFRHNVDWAQIQKTFSSGETANTAPRSARSKRRVVRGDPDPDRISTSYVERQNLTMRMGCGASRGDQRLQPQGGEPGARGQPPLHALQLLPARIRRSSSATRALRRWRREWRTTSGRWKKSAGLSFDPASPLLPAETGI